VEVRAAPPRRVRAEESADLRRDDEVATRLAGEDAAEPPLREPRAVVRRRVEVPHAELPRPVDDGGRGVLVDGLVETCERSGAESQHTKLDHAPSSKITGRRSLDSPL